MDIYYKLRALNKLGVNIILHCFYKHISDTEHLESICKKVHLYKRNKVGIISNFPFIVSSRKSNLLLKRLEKDSHPILIEGIHSTQFLTKLKNTERKIGLRTHNIEHDYYLGLANFSTNKIKRLYYKLEAKRLKKYEEVLDKKLDFIFSLSQKDSLYFKTKYKNAKTFYTCAFYDNNQDVVKPQNYLLLQGNFEVNENQVAADYIIKKIAPFLPKEQFVFAGKSAEKLKNTSVPKNVSIASNISKNEMTKLNKEAKASIVYSHLNAGVKLKILNSLGAGVSTFCNSELELDPYLKNCVEYYSSSSDLIKKIEQLDCSVEKRKETENNFKSVFNLTHFSRQIIDLLEV